MDRVCHLEPTVRSLLRAAVALGVLALAAPAAHTFDCVEKVCARMTSCAEAYYHLDACGEAERDADGDGIPCESLCGKTQEEYLRRRGPALPAATAPLSSSAPQGAPDGPEPGMQCAGKRTCGQMQSCEEARFYLSVCGLKSLDRDKDGVPCEALCGGR